jgi:hypothetical protein
MENLGEVSGIITGVMILVCATAAVIFGDLNKEIYSFILSAELAGGLGFSAGKNLRK